MLIPLTDPEHPLARQMIQLIGAHSHLPETIDAAATDTAPDADAVKQASQPQGTSLADRVLPPRRRVAISGI